MLLLSFLYHRNCAVPFTNLSLRKGRNMLLNVWLMISHLRIKNGIWGRRIAHLHSLSPVKTFFMKFKSEFFFCVEELSAHALGTKPAYLCKIPCHIPMCSAVCATSTALVVFYEGPPDVLCFIFLPSHHSSVSLPPIDPLHCLIPSSSLHLNRSSLWINSKEPIFRRQHVVFRIKTYLHRWR